MKPLVSLITPTYRAGPFLREFLESVLAQSYRPIEFFLVNDGSDDDSEEIVRPYGQRFARAGIAFHYLVQENKGQAAAFNLALPHVTGRYLTWADSDDILHRDNIRLKAEYMRDTAGCHMVRNNALECAEDGVTLINETAKPEDKRTHNIFDALFAGATYCFAGCYMVDTELFRECYPASRIPESPIGQNLQLLLPPASRAECHFIDAPLLIYRRHAHGHSSKKIPFPAALAHRKNLAALLLELVEYCVCDAEKYRALAAWEEGKIFARLRQIRGRRKNNSPESTESAI